MRRMLTSLAALSFLSFVLGCTHTAGVCDCNCETCGHGAPVGAHLSPTPAPELRPEPLQMPKAEVNGVKAEEKPATIPAEQDK